MKFLEEKLWNKHYSKTVLACYWLFGLCNNFAYVVMLSAAHDILASDENNSNHTNSTSPSPHTNHTNKYDCNDLSTGAILLADILPGISIKLLAPFFVHYIKYSHRVGLVVIFNIASYLIVALAGPSQRVLIFFGVCCASLSSSFGELTFLSMSSLYKRELSLTGWGSGTGAAGLIGSFGYAAMTSAGLAPKTTILIMVIVPLILVLAYAFLPSQVYIKTKHYSDLDNKNKPSDDEQAQEEISQNLSLTYAERLMASLQLIKPLIKYMIPLFLVYYSEYFINQGLFELLYFRDSFVKEHKDQYRWYNVIYQLAVFISRSSIRWISTKRLYIFPVLQILNVGIGLSQVYWGWMGSIWVAFALIFWEGLLGGGCYVNAFNLVSIEVPKKNREFSMAFVSIADGLGIAMAGFTAIPVHNLICDYGNRI